ncbi:TIGR01777 family oxidoreductase [Desertivirga brevis]|uniref:TIGR01777 family oxidoreductase n=1 Tax=Desertivirga brevis TaxID=2810310 RepID=UPI001A960820|nr:TIGR01777 family oxidoreductase [Pedobacter sp. SYSU D00873]
MRYGKIILAGGNGYLGGVLAHYYQSRADEVIILSRTQKSDSGNIKILVWDGRTEGEWMNCLENADVLVNLCGKNVNCRYTSENKAEIISSRVVPTSLLGKAVAGMENPPALWINVTSATIYRHAEDCLQDEESGEIGSGFSVEVCREWEDTFFSINTPSTRKIALRMGIVLGQQDGVFPRLLNMVKLGMGGKQGDGQQYVSWIHELDVARSIDWVVNHKDLEGTINCTAPHPLKNKDLMKLLRKAYDVPFGLPTPTWLLEVGARLIGTETELILKSRWVLPKRLLDSGFSFTFPDAASAVRDIITRKN